MSRPSSNIGFIGLGVMGYPMAQNLLSKEPNSNLYIFDVSPDALRRFQSEANIDRVVVCESSRQIAEKSDVIFTMVPEGQHVRQVYLHPKQGLIASNLDSTMLVDLSTIDVQTSSHVRTEITQKFPRANFYDAPVSGGSLGAARATLTIMLGASQEDPNIDRLRKLLGTMGTSIFCCGGPAMGLVAKLCNNYCSGLIALATSEAFNLGIKSGMDPRILASVFATSTAQSTINDTWNPVPGICPAAPASHDYQGGFKVQLMAKDFGLAVDAAKSVGAKLLLGEAGLESYVGASKDPDCHNRDSRVVFRYIGGDENWLAKFDS